MNTTMYNLPNYNIESHLGAGYGERTATLAREAANQQHSQLYLRLSSCMCWDAMLICAGLAQGVRNARLEHACENNINMLQIITSAVYTRVFDQLTYDVTSEQQLANVAPGSFLGFIDTNTNQIAHAMIYVDGGRGAGNKNDCVFTKGASVGWELIDLKAFFGADRERNRHRKMVARPVTGQQIF
jgi:hypothetical protein